VVKAKRKSLDETIVIDEASEAEVWIEIINLADIRIDGGTQMRGGLDPDHVERCADGYRSGKDMPEIEIVRGPDNYSDDPTEYNWLWDGNHRVAGAMKVSRKAVRAKILRGTRRKAVILATQANKNQFSLPRQAGDITRAIRAITSKEGWRQEVSQMIAEEKGFALDPGAEVSEKQLWEFMANWIGCSPDAVRKTVKRDEEAAISTITVESEPFDAYSSEDEGFDDDEPFDRGGQSTPDIVPNFISKPVETPPAPEPKKVVGSDGKSYTKASPPPKPIPTPIILTPRAPEKPIPLLIPQYGELWEKEVYTTFCGTLLEGVSGKLSKPLKDKLPKRSPLAIVSFHYNDSWENEETKSKIFLNLLDMADIVAVYCENPDLVTDLYSFYTDDRDPSFLYSVGTIFNGQVWGILLLFSKRDVSRDKDFKEKVAKGSPNALLASLAAGYAIVKNKPDPDPVIIVDMPRGSQFSPILTLDSLKLKTFLICPDGNEIGRAIQDYKVMADL
jgi:hypothetical protein